MSSEIFFWEHNYYKYSRMGERPRWWNCANPTYAYPPEMTQVLELLLKKNISDLKILDVGSGPISALVNKLDITRYKVTTVDPLANIYNSLNSKYNIPWPIKCIEGTGEHLNDLLPPESYDLVFSQNSIDHSEDPSKYIWNLYYALKPGGIMYLSGAIREGTSENWIGLHQHDLFILEDDLYWINRSGSVKDRNLTRDLNMKVLFECVGDNQPASIYTIVFFKI